MSVKVALFFFFFESKTDVTYLTNIQNSEHSVRFKIHWLKFTVPFFFFLFSSFFFFSFIFKIRFQAFIICLLSMSLSGNFAFKNGNKIKIKTMKGAACIGEV